MPRRNTPRRGASRREGTRRTDAVGDLGARVWGAQEVHPDPDGAWAVRTVPGAAATKAYQCPGCAQQIAPGTAHVVAWRAGGDGTDRRHWHTACWRKRDHRTARHPRR